MDSKAPDKVGASHAGYHKDLLSNCSAACVKLIKRVLQQVPIPILSNIVQDLRGHFKDSEYLPILAILETWGSGQKYASVSSCTENFHSPHVTRCHEGNDRSHLLPMGSEKTLHPRDVGHTNKATRRVPTVRSRRTYRRGLRRQKRALLKGDCAECSARTSPLWRVGPDGRKNLCNACGLRWSKKKRKAVV